MEELIIRNELEKLFAKKKDIITEEELLCFLEGNIPNFDIDYKNKYIKKLYDLNMLYCYYDPIDRSRLFKPCKNKCKYISEIDEEVEKDLLPIIKEKDIETCYFNSSFFNSLSSLQAIKSYKYIGVKSYAEEYVISKIEKKQKSIISSRDYVKLSKLFGGIKFDFQYIVFNINVDTPLIKNIQSCFLLPKIETLLVLLLTDDVLKTIYSSEIENIYFNAFKRYMININTLFRYASKKYVADDVKSILKDINFNLEKGEFYD